jgi:hypothetical protein
MEIRRFLLAAACVTLGLAPLTAPPAAAQESAPEPAPAGCAGVTYANVVAFDQPWLWNRFGAMEPQGMMYALRRDVVPTTDVDGLPDPGVTYTLSAGQVSLRSDKRPRPLVLRVNAGDCLHIHFTNLLASTVQSGKDEQPATRQASMHFVGLEAVKGISDMGSNVGQNPASGNGIVAPNGSTDYWLFAPKEGTYVFYSGGAMTGGEGDSGSISAGLFGAVDVEPAGTVWYRSQVTRDDLNLARTDTFTAATDSFPTINYGAVYPTTHRYASLPILAMKSGSEIVHSDLTAIIAGPAGSGYLIPGVASTKTYPNRNQPFREFTIIFHDETGAVQAFPQFESDDLGFTLHSVRDSFAINYGTGGIGAEILANRVGVGPARDCPECMYEEFFLSSWALGDPAMVVDKPANAPCTQVQLQAGTPNCYTTNVAKATKAFYPDDPSNVYHSYMSDHVKFRNLHAGSDDHHIFHLHAHQWLHTPNSDTSAYKDSQSIGQGAGYTYEIAHGGSGNRNKTVGDSIFHCHFYAHFAQGMWSLWRVHDVLELGTQLDSKGRPAAGSRALPDNEILAGTPIPALVPIPVLAMAPLPGPVSIVAGQVSLPATVTVNPGYPFFVPGRAGRRPPHPPLDFALDAASQPIDGGLPRHIVLSGVAGHTETRFNFEKSLQTLNVQWLAEGGEPVEKVAMKFHAKAAGYATVTPLGTPATFKVNGHPAQQGAPYADPCFDDAGNVITSVRNYKAADIQLDIKLNKGGWHYPQARMLALWGDVNGLLAGTKAPEPFFFRANSGECIEYWHTNLAPNKYVVDDFQVTTPTDILGQHIHLVKFDVTSSDGSGNGWNYEDGTFAGQEVQERICAIRQAQPGHCGEPSTAACAFGGAATTNCPVPKVHPFFNQFQDADCNGVNDFLGAQTTIQRWWADPITNQDGTGRTLRTIFTHDHFGPSTHQQTGLYAGLVIEPAGTTWFQNETGVQLGTNNGTAIGNDGGPTSWQAVISSPVAKDNYREFMIEFADFQPAYTPGGPVCPSRDLSVGWIDPARAVNPPGREEVGLPNLYAKATQCPGPDGGPSSSSLPPPCPEAVSADDIGMMAVNYRNEPVGLRVRKPSTNTQAAGLKGDLSFAYQSRTDRADAAFNVQPSFYPPLTSGLAPGDPYTPLLRSFEGDQVKVRMLVGAHEEPHNFTIFGLKWLFEPDDPSSGYRNSQMAGISEWFDFEIPRVPSLPDGGSADFLYKPSAATESQWTGAWGILRVYRNGTASAPSSDAFSLVPLNTSNPAARSPTPDSVFATIPASQARAEGVPGRDVDPASPVPTNEAATPGDTVNVSKAVAGGTIAVACPAGTSYRVYDVTAVSAAEVLQNDPIGLPGLVYNPRAASGSGPAGAFSGPLYDPTAILFAFTSDLSYVGTPARPRLNQNVRREPLILRANAGECIKVTLRNDLPASYADAQGFTGVNMIVEGFNQNDVAPSQEVSLHPQLVFYDVQRSDGSNVGLNPSQFGKQTAGPGQLRTYYWYAGDVQGTTAIPIEYGATGLTSADPIKHSNKGLMGSLIIEPATASWALDQDSNLKTTRASATVSSTTAAFNPFHEFAFVIQDDVNLQYAGGGAVPNLAVDDDPENSGQKAINYRAEPLWYRGGWGPETPLTGNGPGFRTRLFTHFDRLLDNSWVGGDPETPVFQARAGENLRFRVVHPAGHTQAHVFEAYGHPWPERPYATGSNSTRIGANSTSEWFGTRGGVGPSDHFDALVTDGAGGKFKITGDYLYRDYPGPRLDAGIWGILRIVP